MTSREKPSATPIPKDTPSIEQQAAYISIWKTAVDTQMHFNEMCGKARQFGLTFVAAALGLAVVLMSRGQEFSLAVHIFGGFQLHAIVVVVFASAFALYAVKVLDLNVYHKMLRGAVTFGEDFEESYMKQIFNLEKGMTQAISHYSRHKDANVDRQLKPYHFTGASMKRAADKVARFYHLSIGALLLLGIGLFFCTWHQGASRPGETVPAPPSLTSLAAPAPATGGTDAK